MKTVFRYAAQYILRNLGRGTLLTFPAECRLTPASY